MVLIVLDPKKRMVFIEKLLHVNEVAKVMSCYYMNGCKYPNSVEKNKPSYFVCLFALIVTFQ